MAVVEGIEGTLHVADFARETLRSIPLVGPELDETRRRHAQHPPGGSPRARYVLINTLATTPAGHIFVGVTGYRDAAILRFDANGTLTGRFRCRLPAYANRPMLPSQISVTDTILFIADPGGRVAFYNLQSSMVEVRK